MTARGPTPGRTSGRVARMVAAWAASAALASPARAQQVAVRHYTVADGLADNEVNAIFQDGRGFLWFATKDGVSRFDGYAFTNYGPEDGLPHPFVHELAEDAHGTLWAAPWRGGLARLVEDPRARAAGRRFAAVDVNGAAVGVVQLDARGGLVCVTDRGVLSGTPDERGVVAFRRLSPLDSGPADPRAFRDRAGRLWLSLDRTLLVVSADGEKLTRYGPDDGIGRSWVVAVTEDSSGRILAANTRELYELVEAGDATGRHRGSWRRLPLALGDRELRALAFDALGRLWIGTTRGLLFWRDGRLVPMRLIGGPEGHVEALRVDREGHVWIATHGEGVFRAARVPVVTYGLREGLPDTAVHRVVEGTDGRIYACTQSAIVEVAEDRVAPVPGADRPRFHRVGAHAACDRHGNFWVGTGRGEVFFVAGPRLDLRRAELLWRGTPDANWGGPALIRNAAGQVWIGAGRDRVFKATVDGAGRPRLELIRIAEPGAWPVRRLATDGSGTMWLASVSRLWRRRAGRLEELTLPGAPNVAPRELLVDSRGWMWVGSRYGGLAVTRDPQADVPTFEVFDHRRGLGSDSVLSIAEDAQGRIYAGTRRGVDRLDPVTGEIRRLGVADGLAGSPVGHCLVDGRNRLWASSPGGLSRVDIETDPDSPPTPRLTGLTVSGEAQAVPERGARTLAPLRLAAGRNDVGVEYGSLAFDGPHAVLYQYRLIGSSEEWSPPSPDRRVPFARLAPGGYRFEVRALRPGGRPSAAAGFDFTIEAPLWRRPWFLVLVVGSVAGFGLLVQRARLRHLLAMERLRSQVALDLHDDVGAGLSQIAMLSSIAGEEPASAGSLAAQIGGLARGLRQSMADIVWAVDPRHDSAVELVRRMKEVAFGLLEAGGVKVGFDASPEPELKPLLLAPDRRRHLLLAFKEMVHNAARHSGAREVRITLRASPASVVLEVADDGRGFDPLAARRGHGLASLRRRAEELGGRLRIESRPGGPTLVGLEARLRAGK